MATQLQNEGYLYAFSNGSFEKDKNKKETILPYRLNKASNELIRVLVADDHPYLVHGVENDLNKDLKIKIVGVAASYDELINKAAQLQPRVILLD